VAVLSEDVGGRAEQAVANLRRADAGDTTHTMNLMTVHLSAQERRQEPADSTGVRALRWRTKDRRQLAPSNSGMPRRPHGMRCSVFSFELNASNNANPASRGTISSSDCSTNSTGIVIAAAASFIGWLPGHSPASPKTAA